MGGAIALSQPLAGVVYVVTAALLVSLSIYGSNGNFNLSG